MLCKATITLLCSFGLPAIHTAAAQLILPNFTHNAPPTYYKIGAEAVLVSSVANVTVGNSTPLLSLLAPYERSMGSCLSAVGKSTGSAQAQGTPDGTVSTSSGPTRATTNIVRIDWGTVLGYNISYNFWKDHGFVFPVLISYERSLSGRWSAGGEVLVNGGDPTQRRSGAGILVRYYALPAGRYAPPLAGAYVSPVVHYRALRITEGYWGNTPATTYAKRIATGLLLGWQQPIGKYAGPRFVLDMAAGTYYQMRIGVDRTNDPYAYYSTFGDIYQQERVRPGFRPDVRLGIGYQF